MAFSNSGITHTHTLRYTTNTHTVAHMYSHDCKSLLEQYSGKDKQPQKNISTEQVALGCYLLWQTKKR